MKYYLNFLSILFTVILVFSCDNSGNTNNDTTVNIKAIPNIVIPVRNAIPVTTPIETEQYTGTITWSPNHTSFAAETVYTATINLIVKTGFKFNGVAANFFTVSGATIVTNAANSGDVTATFPTTGAIPDIDVTFTGATQTGGTSETANTTGLNLEFDIDPETLTADNITVTGATKGILSDTGTTRTLTISNLTVANGGTITITISSPNGYAITGTPKTAVVYRLNIAVTLISVTQSGGISDSVDSNKLDLTFDIDPEALANSNITISGAKKGSLLTGSGTTRSIYISNHTVHNGETVSIAITNPPGYTIIGSPKTVVIYRRMYYIGKPYMGGVIAYIFQSGEPGYVSGETHGIIAATEDQSTSIIWCLPPYQNSSISNLAKELGTGLTNTNTLISINDPANEGLVTYAAGLAKAHRGGGFDDWYLPSLDELYKLYLNHEQIGGFQIQSNAYWSSSGNGYNAWLVFFWVGDQFYNDTHFDYCVRAIRNF